MMFPQSRLISRTSSAQRRLLLLATAFLAVVPVEVVCQRNAVEIHSDAFHRPIEQASQQGLDALPELNGLLDSQRPELSGLVLSLVDKDGQRQDGFLQVHEIYNLKLPAAQQRN